MPQTNDPLPAVDIKPRSREVTDGLEKAAARGMLRAVGMDDDDFAKPQIGVASSWNEITPCNLSLDRLAKAVKEGVFAAGGYPLEFGTISVSDGISMGHEGMHFSLVSREVIADSVETVMQAERLDGSVLLAGCDKSLPGMLMAAARLDLAAVFLYAGTILPGRVKLSDGSEREVTIIDAFEAVGACARGLMPREDVDAIERAICPGEGACGGMYTANTMASAAEALGMSLPGSAAPPATDRRPAVAGRLQPDRVEGAAPGRREAVRPPRHVRCRPHRRRPGGDEGAAGRWPFTRRLPDGDRSDHGREPGRHRPAGPGRQGAAGAQQPDSPDRGDHHPARIAGSRRRGGQDGRLRLRRVRRHGKGFRRRARRAGRPRGRHHHQGRRRGDPL